jgi:F-type H+-transporting ATPase subunit delta
VTGSLSRRYARALLGLVHERNALDEVGDELARTVGTFDEPRLRAVVLNPGIDAGARRRIVKNVVAALGVSEVVANLVRLLADRDRLPLLPDLLRAYEALVDRSLGRTRVRVRSATALGASEKTTMTDLARRLVGGDVLVSTEVDPELLGGVVLDAGGTVYDGSVRTQLARLGKQIAGEGA